MSLIESDTTQINLFISTVDESLVNVDEECTYFSASLLGLKPKTADLYVQNVLDCWGNM